MSGSALRSRLTDAKTAADKSVKDKSTRVPLPDLVPDLQLVAVVDAPDGEESASIAQAEAAPLTDAVRPARSSTTVRPERTTPPARTRSTEEEATGGVTGVELDAVIALSSPPAAMGMAPESRLLAVPMTEDAYRLLQHLDRSLALARRRPVNRVRLLTLALERVLSDPEDFHRRFLAEYQAGASWKRRVQARIPVHLADQLPALRYTGESRQSAGMLVSIAVTELLEAARDALQVPERNDVAM